MECLSTSDEALDARLLSKDSICAALDAMCPPPGTANYRGQAGASTAYLYCVLASTHPLSGIYTSVQLCSVCLDVRL